MSTSTYFHASWDPLLKIITSAVCAFAILIMVYNPKPLTILLLSVLIIIPAFYMIRGYSVENRTLIIHRLGWSKEIDIADVQNIEIVPGAMKGSLRLLGNGGMFGYIGTFSNRELGTYRAYATSLSKCVVLELDDNRKLVITPDGPDDFVEVTRGLVTR